MANTFNLGNGNWAQKTEKLLAYNAENDNYKPLPFDFDRGSTATVVNKDGLIETVGTDEPRIDFLNNTKGHLLLEPSRTNSYINSEPTANEGTAAGVSYVDFNWSLGFTNCVKFGDNSIIRFRYGATVVSSTEYTISAFVIMDDLTEPIASTSSVLGDFSFVVGGALVTTINNNIYYGNNIYKVSATTTSGTNINNNGIVKYTSQSSKGFRVVGWQVEAGSYATSYIPTSGSAVTRSAETCNNAGNSTVFNDSEGVLYAEIAALYNDGTNRSISISDSTGANRIELRLATTDDRIQYNARTSSVTQASIFTDAYDVLDYNKIAVVYKDNDFRLFVNGTQVATDTSGSAPTGLKELAFDLGDGSNDFYGNVKDIKVYNTALSDSELQALTS
jgi:hypothetical protein